MKCKVTVTRYRNTNDIYIFFSRGKRLNVRLDIGTLCGSPRTESGPIDDLSLRVAEQVHDLGEVEIDPKVIRQLQAVERQMVKAYDSLQFIQGLIPPHNTTYA